MGLGIPDHGAELVQGELSPAPPDACLTEEHRSAIVALDRERGDQHHWGSEQQQNGRADEVQDSFGEQLTARKRGGLDVQQRFVRHRDRVHSAMVEAAQAVRKLHVDAVAREGPDDEVQRPWRDLGRSDEHPDRAGCSHRVSDLLDRAEPGNPRDGVVTHRADNAQSSLRVGADECLEFPGLGAVSDQHDGPGEVAGSAPGSEPLSEAPACHRDEDERAAGAPYGAGE